MSITKSISSKPLFISLCVKNHTSIAVKNIINANRRSLRAGSHARAARVGERSEPAGSQQESEAQNSCLLLVGSACSPTRSLGFAACTCFPKVSLLAGYRRSNEPVMQIKSLTHGRKPLCSMDSANTGKN